MSYQFIGQPTPRTDNTGKVTGEARYTSDVLLPGTLWAKTLRSPYSHARIKRMDISRAEKAPGVRAILTGEDVRGILYGRRYRDISVLAQDRARFLRERDCAVAGAHSLRAPLSRHVGARSRSRAFPGRASCRCGGGHRRAG